MDFLQDINRQQNALRQRLQNCLSYNDAAEIKRLFEELLDAERRCCTLLKQANDAILLFHLETQQIVDANPKAAEMFGYPLNELLGMRVSALHPEEQREAINTQYAKAIAESSYTLSKLPVVKNDGTPLYADVSVANIADPAAPVVQAIYHDVTRIYQLYENAEAEKIQLEEAEQLRTEFLALISHELRTPLNSIIGYNSLLEEGVYGDLQPQQEKAVQRVDRNATRLLALINQLLDLSRIEAGVISVVQEPVELGSIIKQVLKDYEMLAEEKGLKLELAHLDQGAYVQTDPDKIQEVIRQLISNAIKFTSEGQVKIELQEHDEKLWLHIHDTGSGIDPAKRDAIFGLFQQGDAHKTRRHAGAGLGLAIVKRLSDLLGVEVNLQSQPREGSTFSLAFQALKPNTEKTEKPQTAVEPQPALSSETKVAEPGESQTPTHVEGHPRQILIVDDDPYTVELLSDFLEAKGGFRVKKAYSGMHAMMYLAKSRPDYLLVDLLMPQINGERVIQCCRNLWGDEVKVIIITGKDLSEDERQQLQQQADHIIQKGESPQGLTKSLEAVIPMPALT